MTHADKVDAKIDAVDDAAKALVNQAATMYDEKWLAGRRIRAFKAEQARRQREARRPVPQHAEVAARFLASKGWDVT